MPDLGRLRDEALARGANVVLPAYARVASTVEQVGSTGVGKAVGRVLDKGQTMAAPLLGVLERTVRGHSEPVAPATGRKKRPSGTSAAKGGPRARRAGSNGIGSSVASKVPAAPEPVAEIDLPLVGYDALVADEVVKRLEGLTQTDLAVVFKYERAHDARSTVLEALEGRMVELPLPTYDSLSLAAILDDLNGLTRGELEIIRGYELRTRNRLPVIEKIDSLLAVEV